MRDKNTRNNKNDTGHFSNGGFGTVVQQFTDVAFELIQLALERGWTGVETLPKK